MLLCLVVVELDPPYDSRFAAQYGENFKAWDAYNYAELSQAITKIFKSFDPAIVVHFSALE